ncbi:MAG: 50S ribosomal protein L13 [Acidobacteriota bacterium]|nr:MAG: 50S ribosomal protein L13 [Acidobacteriota bacterium]
MKTFFPSAGEIQRNWWVVDATGVPLGRLASVVATRLRGKHKPEFTPFLDCGDHVIVINAAKAVLTGRKVDQKRYYHHSGYPGGLTEIPARRLLAEKPVRAVELAVRRMLPKNRLGRRMYTKLKVYAGPEHPHQAQKPQPLDAAALSTSRSA